RPPLRGSRVCVRSSGGNRSTYCELPKMLDFLHGKYWMTLHVQCYAGRKADERPVRFRLRDCEFLVEEILVELYGPVDLFFKVRADEGIHYILWHTQIADDWRLEAFRHISK